MNCRMILCGVLTALLATLLAGCSGPEPIRELCGVELNRGHGSMWGEQLHICIDPEAVRSASWFTEEAVECTARNVPISPQSWQEVAQRIQAMLPELVEVTPNRMAGLLEKLGLMPQVLDGGVYHELTLTWLENSEEKKIQYVWSDTPLQKELEDYLEQLANSLPAE